MATLITARWFYVREALAGVALVALLSVAAMAEESVSKTVAANGNIDLDCPDAPRATFELDLSQGMFHDLFGIGDAAIAGAVESLKQTATDKTDSKESHLAAEQLEAVQQLLQLSGNLVQGVRVRVYELGTDKQDPTEKFSAYYGNKLHAGNWESVCRVHDDDTTVAVSVLRSSGAIKGVFLIANDGDNVVLTNMVCDISPDNMKKLGAAIAKSGLDTDLKHVIDIQMQEFRTPAEPPAEKSAEKP
jgi:hypothetical protein